MRTLGFIRSPHRGAILSLLLLLFAAVLPVRAGGPFASTGTTPHRFPAVAFPLAYRYDQGALGTFTNNVAKSIADYAFAQWDNVGTAALSFAVPVQLPRNVSTATDPYISGAGQFSDGINPVVFDNDGSITDGLIGVGAKNAVYGFSTSVATGTQLDEGFVIINGHLSGTGSPADEDIFKAVITHEVGHFLGLGHSLVAMHGDVATMYPSVENNAQQTLEPDDRAAISLLYPNAGYIATVGSISGTVTSPGGALLSGVNVIAVDSLTGNSYSSVVDYHSGGAVMFASPPTATGTYTISGLPAGKYCVRIEPIDPFFSGGSGVASYSTPINTTIAREWYNGGVESGDMLLDNTNEMSGVTVTAGLTTGSINFVSNESSTISPIAYHKSMYAVTFTLPIPGVDAYGTKFTAPSKGSLLGMKLELLPGSIMPNNGNLTVGVYTNTAGGLAGVPGSLLGSVTIPFRFLAVGQPSEIWLRGIGGPVNFNSGDHFHIVLSSNNVGAIEFAGDDGEPTQSRSSYRVTQEGWRNYPEGTDAGYNIMMTAVYTTAAAGSPQPAATVNPGVLSFGRRRPGGTVERTVTVGNPGTAALNVSATTLGGSNASEFSVVSGGGAFTLNRGETRDIVVRFAPADAAGNKNATLSIASNAPTTPTTVPLAGMGVQALATEQLTEIDFGSRRTGVTAAIDSVVLRNTGNDTLHISTISLEGGDSAAYLIFGSRGPLNIAPNMNYTARLRFTPEERRNYSTTLRVTHDDPDAVSIFMLRGKGVASVVASKSDTLAFGEVEVGSSATSSDFFIANNGDAPLVINKIEVWGSDDERFSVEAPTSFPITLQPAGKLPVDVRFAPTAAAAYRTFLRITSDASPSVALVTVTGHGAGATLGVPVSTPPAAGITLLPVVPSPARGWAEIGWRMQGYVDSPIEITVTDIQGRRVTSISFPDASPGEHRTRINLDGFASGEYHVTLRSRGDVISTKLVVVR